MNNKEREIANLEMQELFARMYHYSMVGLAAISSSAVLSSVPLIILNVLPTWADIALVGGGGLLAPGSIHETGTTKRWLEGAISQADESEIQ